MDNIQLAQQQYISEWHDNFVNYIGGLDKIEKLNKDLVDMAIEHLSTDAVVLGTAHLITQIKAAWI